MAIVVNCVSVGPCTPLPATYQGKAHPHCLPPRGGALAGPGAPGCMGRLRNGPAITVARPGPPTICIHTTQSFNVITSLAGSPSHQHYHDLIKHHSILKKILRKSSTNP